MMTKMQDHAPVYNNLILDCDGVIFDSNQIKSNNISQAAHSITSDEDLIDEFVEYFTKHNGMPREYKIEQFFGRERTFDLLLNRYRQLNYASFSVLGPLIGAHRFMRESAERGFHLIVLSGGAVDEVRALLERTGLAGYCDEILGGPTTKAEHLESLSLPGRTCYFGDSEHDYHVARRFGVDFVFLWRYTQFDKWKAFFADKPEVQIRPELHPDLIRDLCYE